MMEKALIIIDYIYDFIADDGRLTCGKPGQDIEKNIVALVKKFSDEGELVVTASDFHNQDDKYNKERDMFPLHCYDDKGRAIYGEVENELAKVDNQQILRLNKDRYSAFYATALDLKLKERGIKEVCLVGVCTDICVLHTAVDAYNLGYEITVYENGVASFNESGHNFALSHFKNTLAANVISI